MQRQMPTSVVILRRLPDNLSRICLTFDDGPDPNYTPRVLDALAEADVRATFFVVGSAAVRDPQLVRRALAEGHEVANHTWSHAHPRLLPATQVQHEVAAANHAIADIVGKAPRYFRPPFGHMRRSMVDAAHTLGQAVVLWSLSGKDWGPMGRASMIARRVARARAGDIILLHDARWRYNRPWETLKVLPEALARLKGAGLTPVLIGDGPRAPSMPVQTASAVS